MVSGLRWSNDLSRWRRYAPRDPAGQLAASFHVYEDNECVTARCWDATLGPIARRYPVITGDGRI